MRKHFTKALLVLVALAGMATTTWAQDKMAKEKSLYDRLGGKKAITAVVDEFVGRCAGDARINGFFKKTAADPKRLAKFKMNLVDQICQASGGPLQVQGQGHEDRPRRYGHRRCGLQRSGGGPGRRAG